jgi:hypothetical protein
MEINERFENPTAAYLQEQPKNNENGELTELVSPQRQYTLSLGKESPNHEQRKLERSEYENKKAHSRLRNADKRATESIAQDLKAQRNSSAMGQNQRLFDKKHM